MKKIILASILLLLGTGLALAADEEWFSIACGTWEVEDGVNVRTSWSGPHATAEEAQQAAIDECNKTGQNCQTRTTWVGGCGWTTTGKKHDETGRAWVRCSTGATKEEALAACQEDGFECNPEPIGACGSAK